LARVGRPTTKKGKAAQAKRLRSRKAYDSLSVSERQALVQKRDKSAQRKADAKRYRSQKSERDTYHRNDARATQGVPKGTKCAKCGSTRNVQRHVVRGKFVNYLCGRCNVAAIKS
jgi:hypothetical protein